MKRAMTGCFLIGFFLGSAPAQSPLPVDGPMTTGRVIEVQADYLFWWTRQPRFGTPLLTQGDPADARPGLIGQPGTQILIGSGEKVGLDGQSGFRGAITYWLGDDSNIGIEVGGFWLGQSSASKTYGSEASGLPVLTQPVIGLDGLPLSYAVSDRSGLGQIAGTYTNEYSSRLFSWEVNGVYDLGSDCNWSVRALVGFRHIGLRDRFSESVLVSDPTGGTATLLFGRVGTTSLTTRDEFRADTDFYGAQIGTRIGYTSGRLGFDVTGKLAVGVSDQRIGIDGVTTNADGQTLPGGLRALSSNIGRYSKTDLAVAPELGLNASYQLTQAIRLRAGYSFLYLSRVVRASDQMDPVTNPRLVPSDREFGLPSTAARPRYDHQGTDFWAHGLNLGVQIDW